MKRILDPAYPDMFNAYVDCVGRIARGLRAISPDLLAFELINEPWFASSAEIGRWPPMLERLHAAARNQSPICRWF